MYSQAASSNDVLQSLLVVGTFLAVIVALFGPFLVEMWKRKYREAKLDVEFALNPPDCHITTLSNGISSSPVYYFRFRVVNNGKTQSEETETILERIYKKSRSGRFVLENNFTPVNLSWSARDNKHRTIQPNRSVFVDLGSIRHPSIEILSVFRGATPDEQRSLKFFFAQAENRLFSQWDCLVPGKYKVCIAIYSKNAPKASREFFINWSGNWQDEEKDMFKELTIK